MNQKILIAATLLAAATVQAAEDGDWQTWNFANVKYLDTNKLDLAAVGQFRLRDDFSEFSHFTLSQRVQFDPRPWLSLSLNYTWLHTLPVDADEFVDIHRPELEISPRWHALGLNWELRNRLELRYLQGVDEVRPRLRHRLQGTLPLTSMGKLTALIFSNEVFYDTTLDRLSENRFLPIALSFRLSPDATLTTGYGLQSLWNKGEWLQSNIIVSMLQFTF